MLSVWEYENGYVYVRMGGGELGERACWDPHACMSVRPCLCEDRKKREREKKITLMSVALDGYRQISAQHHQTNNRLIAITDIWHCNYKKLKKSAQLTDGVYSAAKLPVFTSRERINVSLYLRHIIVSTVVIIIIIYFCNTYYEHVIQCAVVPYTRYKIHLIWQ